MLKRLGLAGVLGVLLMIVGIAILALENLLIAGGVALVIAGIGMVAYGMVKSMLGAFGLA
jgi:hypothetical protein